MLLATVLLHVRMQGDLPRIAYFTFADKFISDMTTIHLAKISRMKRFSEEF